MAKSVAIIGAGLAGAACASAFAHAGYRVSVYERGDTWAAAASGVPIALFAPSVSSDDAAHSRLLRRGVHVLLGELRRLTSAGLLLEGWDWALTGVRERCIRGNKTLPRVWLEPQDLPHLQSQVLPNPVGNAQELWHGAAGWVNPVRLIEAWLAHPNITMRTNERIHDLQTLSADIVLVACGYQSPDLLPALADALQPIRGQVEWGTQTVQSALSADMLKLPVNGMGHFISARGAWLAGATFQRDEVDLAPCRKDIDKNFAKLALLCPELSALDLTKLCAASKSWVGVRAAQKNRLPITEKLSTPTHLNVWVCAGLGSRGLSLAALCASRLLAGVQDSLALG